MIFVAADYQNSGTAITWRELQAGKSALEAMEQGIRAVESNEVDWSVGKGGYPNALGEVELDAGVMDGRTRASGAVGGLKGFLHPVSVAYAAMQRLPHVLLVGEGAARFADEIGAERDDLLTDVMRQNYAQWQKDFLEGSSSADLINAVKRSADPQRKDETTVYLAQDRNGDIAAATSTSGWAWKYPGRLGDTPIAGAGFYADNRYGAAACTGKGELAIRTSLARFTVSLMQAGRSVQDATQEALLDLLRLPDIGEAELQLHAIDAHGNHDVSFIGSANVADWHFYYVAQDEDEVPVRRNARRVAN
jgi:L-asparaginase